MNENIHGSTPEHVAGCVALAVGDTLRVEDPAAVLVYVPQGSVWITEEGGGDDIVLREGGWSRLRRPGVAVVEALAPTVLVLTSPSADRPARTLRVRDRPALPGIGRTAPRPRWARARAAWQQWWQRPGFARGRDVLAAASRLG